MTCVGCGAPWHPASGDYDRRFGVGTCRRCVHEFWTWFRKHSKRVWKVRDASGRVTAELLFYPHAATSIRAGVTPDLTDAIGNATTEGRC